MARYFRHYNNAMTVMQRAGRMNRPSLFGLGGFGQTDPILDAPPEVTGEVAPDQEAMVATDTAGQDVGADLVADSVEPPISTISFYPDGTWFTSTPGGNTRATEWTDAMAAALGADRLASADEMLAKARSGSSSGKVWKWVALLGIPAAAGGAWYAHKKWGR